VTQTGVRLKLVRERLQATTEQLQALRALPQASKEEFIADRRNPDAAESNLRRALEALFDVARHLLSKVYGLGALEYKEVARLSGQKGLITDRRVSPVDMHRFPMYVCLGFRCIEPMTVFEGTHYEPQRHATRPHPAGAQRGR
jgi:hypothetical protein